MMLIERAECKKLVFPLRKPITTNLHTIDKINGLVLNIYTKNDVVGFGFIYGLGKASLEKLAYHASEYAALAISQKACTSQTQWIDFWHTCRLNKTAEEIYALAILDIALWDAFGKEEKKSLRQLLNFKTIRNQIPVYGTTGWLSLTEEQLIEECKKYTQLGVKAFKIRLGHPNDYERVKAVREFMGEKQILMLDANQRYSLEEALLVSRQMADLNITWLEEPVGNSLEDSIAITQQSSIPIAIGENIFDKSSFERACQYKAANIFQPDLIRCGGITGFIEVSEVIRKNNFPLCNHLLPELSANVLAGFSTAYYLEYDDLLPNGIYTKDFNIQDGYMPTYDLPGTGVSLTEDAIKTFSIK